MLRVSSGKNDDNSNKNRNRTKRKKLTIFLNGNPTFKGQEIYFDLLDYRSLDELLTFISSTIQTGKENKPNIRQLFTPRGFHRVKRIKDIVNGNVYVCAGSELFKPIKYPFNDPLSMDNLPVPICRYSLHYDEGREIWKLHSFFSPQSKTSDPNERLLLIVRKFGKSINVLNYYLKKKYATTLGQVYSDISIAFGPKWSFDRIRSLYHLHGCEVRSLQELLKNDSIYIAIGNNPRIKGDKESFMHRGSSFIPDGNEIKAIFEQNKIKCDEFDRIKKTWNTRVQKQTQSSATATTADSPSIKLKVHGTSPNKQNQISLLKGKHSQRKSKSGHQYEDVEADSGFDEYINKKSQILSSNSAKINVPHSNLPSSKHNKLFPSDSSGRSVFTSLDSPTSQMNLQKNLPYSPIRSGNLYKNKTSVEKILESISCTKNNEEDIGQDKPCIEVPIVTRNVSYIITRHYHDKEELKALISRRKFRHKVPDDQVMKFKEDRQRYNWRFIKKSLSSKEVLQQYDIKQKLGDGNFAIVKHGVNKLSQKEVAIKTISKSKLIGKESMLNNEISIMKRCKHTNIIQIYDAFETGDEIWIEMELINGGDLFDSITKSVKFPENIAAKMIHDISRALFYLHCRFIVHRDLKPENLLVSKNKNGSMTLKLADFGLAIEVKRPLYTICGTPTYIAPEILYETGYGMPVDLWALGIISYILLCGFPPFRSFKRRQTELFSKIKSGKFEFVKPFWGNVSKDAKDLIKNLLVTDPLHRFKAIDVLTHPWTFKFNDPEAMKLPSLDSKVLEENLKEHRKKLENEHDCVMKRRQARHRSDVRRPLNHIPLKSAQQAVSSSRV